jgi:GTP cyclohydrolase IA
LAVECTKSQVLESALAEDWEFTVKKFLYSLQEDPEREGLQETPARFLKAMQEMLKGYKEDPSEYLSKQFESTSDEMVVVKDIPFVSMCEHHMLPFSGHVTVAYLPSGSIVGLSKIPRAVQALARRLQVQERFTEEIANTLFGSFEDCLGVGVRVTGEHSCMKYRGVQSSGTMVTCKLMGNFRRGSVRNEFLSLCGE